MYKTVRHGENSLQYTILPQTEEVLSNSGLKGKGRDYSPSIHVRRRRRSTLKYVLMVIFGTVVALALASVPLYVMNGAIFARRLQFEHHDTTTPALTPGGREILRSRKKEMKISEIITVKPKEEVTTSTTMSTTSTTPPTSTSERITTPWTMPALRSWKYSGSTVLPQLPTEDIERIPLIGTPSGSVRLLDHYMSMRPWDKDIIIRATVTPEPITIRNVFNYYSRVFDPTQKIVTDSPKVFEDVLITTKSTPITSTTTEVTTSDMTKFNNLKDALLSADNDEEAKESLEFDEVFSLPPLKPDAVVPSSDADEVTVSKTNFGWYGKKFSFIDTSGFQWPVHGSASDTIFLFLTIAMSVITVALLISMAVKARKEPSSNLSACEEIAVESHNDDNTVLLEAENPEADE
ncbi:unnamed protein product [Leptosia nina]|uniref:Uncharacterized protein n=1 Tax=Leptosia nina TaxID=320188 RepID=A0AAV1J0V1_9NEOP